MKKRSLEDWFEIVSVFLLSAATLTSAWCAAQGDLWSSAQLGSLADFNEHNRIILEKNTKAGQIKAIDLLVFTQYTNAIAEGKIKLADFYLQRFRPETKPALEAWLATKPLTNVSAPSSPFSMPEYKIALDDEVAQLRLKAERSYKEQEEYNAISDRYVLLMVFYTAVLFFVGMAPKFSHLWMRGLFMSMGAFIWVVCCLLMCTLPVTWTRIIGILK